MKKETKMTNIQLSPEVLQRSKDITCKNCKGKVFIPTVAMKQISVIDSPIGQEGIATIPLGNICATCFQLATDITLKKKEKFNQ